MYKLNFMYMNIPFKIRVRIFVKKIIHLNFISKFLGRIFFQSLVKTFRLFSNFTRLKGSIWVDLNKDLFDTWAIKKDKELYIQATNFFLKFSKEKKKIINEILPSNRGGGGNEKLLYFLINIINGKNVLETGVSAGSSSRTILEALKEDGMLYSSDLALDLDKDQVGILVSERFRKNWFIAHEGDKINIPKILEKENNFDLIYYDSDKSYFSKKWFHDEIVKKLSPKILIYDDIDRDSFFSECVTTFGYNFKVFGNAGIIFFDHKFL